MSALTTLEKELQLALFNLLLAVCPADPKHKGRFVLDIDSLEPHFRDQAKLAMEALNKAAEKVSISAPSK